MVTKGNLIPDGENTMQYTYDILLNCMLDRGMVTQEAPETYKERLRCITQGEG